MAGLEVEAAYGVNVLKYTETVPSTSATSNATDILRGLGYWYFYGSDHLGPWTNAAIRYTQNVILPATSFAVPVLAVIGAAFVRWRERAFFLVLLFVGPRARRRALPLHRPDAAGRLAQVVHDGHDGGTGPALDRPGHPGRPTGPVHAAGQRARPHCGGAPSASGSPPPSSSAALVVANNPSLFNGDTIANNFTQPASLPSYQMAAIDHLNATHPGTRVFAIPGNDFASYRWGDTVDTPAAGPLEPATS